MIINVFGKFITELLNNRITEGAKELDKSDLIQQNQTGMTLGGIAGMTAVTLLTGGTFTPLVLAGILAGGVVGAGGEKVIKEVNKEL